MLACASIVNSTTSRSEPMFSKASGDCWPDLANPVTFDNDSYAVNVLYRIVDMTQSAPLFPPSSLQAGVATPYVRPRVGGGMPFSNLKDLAETFTAHDREPLCAFACFMIGRSSQWRYFRGQEDLESHVLF